MKKSIIIPLLLISIFLFLLPMTLMGQGTFFLDDNGVTISCPGTDPGETGMVDGIEYEAVDRALLIQRRDEGADLSRVCTTPVTDMNRVFSRSDYVMFKVAGSSDTINGGGNTSNEADKDRMVTNDINFNPDIRSWDVSNVTSMANMFEENYYFNRDISKWDVGNVTSMRGMFTNNANYSWSGTGSSFNQDIGDWDVSNVTDMSHMFYAALQFNQDISGWDVSNVTDMRSMFYVASSFNQNLSGWCVSNIPSEPNSFSTDSQLLPEYKPIWGTCPEFQVSFLLDENGVTIRCPDASPGDKGFVDGVEYVAVDRDLLIQRRDEGAALSRLCTTPVTDMSVMFSEDTYSGADSFNQPIGNWDVSSVINMRGLFFEARSFNQDISGWNVSNVTDMRNMFEDARSFNQPIGNWDVSSVTSMGTMFGGAHFFNQDIGGWDVSSVTDMMGMFTSAYEFNQNIGGWDVSNVTDMGWMFRQASAFNQDISGWDVSNVSYMSSMFGNAFSFNQNLSGWCVSNIPSEPETFSTDSPLLPEFKPVWGTCPDESWHLVVDVDIMDYTASATIGVHSFATDGFDEFDIPAPPIPPGDYIRAVFNYPQWNNELGDEFISDIRAPRDLSEAPMEWKLNLTSTVIGEIALSITRPPGFEIPIALFDENKWHISGEGNLDITFDHDGETTREFLIQVGDTTAPVLTVGDTFEGPAIWGSAVNRTFTWQVNGANHLEQVVLEHSSDDGVNWDTLYVGLDNLYDWQPADQRFNEENRFRLTAYDRVGNTSIYKTKTPITIASEKQPLPFEQGWNLVGPPFLSMNNSNQMLEPAYRFEWDGNSYQGFTEYESGNGYWLGALEAGTDTLYGTIAEDAVTVDALQGWSMISSPLMRTVNLDSIEVTNLETEQSLSYAQALDQQWITAPLAYRDASYVNVHEFMPFDGYWLGVYIESARLTLPIHKYAEPDDGQDDPDGPGKIRLLAQEPTPNMIELLVSIGEIQQTLVLDDHQLRNVPAPPPVPNAPRLGLSGTPTVLGDLYLKLGKNVDEQISIPLYRSDDSKKLVLTWKDQKWNDIRATLVMPNGMQYNMLETGSVVIDPGDDMPIIMLSPKTVSALEPGAHPAAYQLFQNYPNPFNPSTQIRFALPHQSHVNLSVFNLLGQRVATLVNETRSTGWHDVPFDARGLSSGVFIYRLEADGYVETRQMLFVK